MRETHMKSINYKKWSWNSCSGGWCELYVRQIYSHQPHIPMGKTGDTWRVTLRPCPTEAGSAVLVDPKQASRQGGGHTLECCKGIEAWAVSGHLCMGFSAGHHFSFYWCFLFGSESLRYNLHNYTSIFTEGKFHFFTLGYISMNIW